MRDPFLEALEALPEDLLAKGEAYVRKGRVLDLVRLGEVLQARVQGTAPHPYRVRLEPGLTGTCTCPYPGWPCKHAAAALLAYERAKEKPKDLLKALEALPPEEAKSLLLALAKALPQVAEALSGYALDPEKEVLRLARLLPSPEAEAEIGRLIAQLALRQNAPALLRLARALEKGAPRPGDCPAAKTLARKAVQSFADIAGAKGLEALLEALSQGSLVAGEGVEALVLAFPETLPEAEAALSRLLKTARGERRLFLYGLLLSLLRALAPEKYVERLKEGLSEPWEYAELVRTLLQLQRREEALRYAREGLEWFGKTEKTLPLLFVLWEEGKDPEALEARFCLRPTLEDYRALREALGRGLAAKRPHLLRRVKDPALRARILLLEEDFKGLERLLQSLSPLEAPRVAEAIQEALPEEAAQLYLQGAEAKVEEKTRSAYAEAAFYLDRAARLMKRPPSELAQALLARYPRRWALREALAPLLGDEKAALAERPPPPLP